MATPDPTGISQGSPQSTQAAPAGRSELRFLALGDSYTIGHSVETSERWPVQLVRRLRESGINVAAPGIIAQTGWTTGDLSAAIDQAVPKGPYDIVSLLIGVNNQFRGLGVGQFQLELAELVQRAVGLAGGEPSHVIVVSIPDWGVTPFAAGLNRNLIAREIDLFNTANREEAHRVGAIYVDVTEVSRRASTDLSLVADDGLHPSGEMYRLWAELILSAITSNLDLAPFLTTTTAVHPSSTATAGPSPTGSVDPAGDLFLPFRIEDIAGSNEFISPFGIVRHSRDAGHGHGGIDIPLKEGAPIYAVAAGTILSVETSSDGAGGFDVKLLITGFGGSGWGFLYEHVSLEPGIIPGSAVAQGQLIARNGLTTSHRNNHLQLTYLFNDYQFFRDHRCWVDYLGQDSRASLRDYFRSADTIARLTVRWESASEEGMNAYVELLNPERFPDGLQLCYPLGLDVRVPE